MREQLAEYAHEAWSGWMKYLFEKSQHNDDGTVTIPAWAVERWKRQMNTAYADLPEQEKESDRAEADEIMAILLREGGVDNVNTEWVILTSVLLPYFAAKAHDIVDSVAGTSYSRQGRAWYAVHKALKKIVPTLKAAVYADMESEHLRQYYKEKRQ